MIIMFCFPYFQFNAQKKIGNLKKKKNRPQALFHSNICLICVPKKLFIMALLTYTVGLANKLLCLWRFMSCSSPCKHTDLLSPSPCLLLLLLGSLGLLDVVARPDGSAAAWQPASPIQSIRCVG